MEILIICKHQEIAKTIARLVNNHNNWRATVALNTNEAFIACMPQTFDVILVGSGVTEEEELKFKNRLSLLNVKSPVIKHYGGGSGLLFAEIYQAIQK